MKRVAVFFLYSLYCSLLFSQVTVKQTTKYFNEDRQFFSEDTMFKSFNFKKDTILVKSCKAIKIIQDEFKGKQFITYLGCGLFFLITDNELTKIVKRVKLIRPYILYPDLVMYPKDILGHDFDKDSINEIVITYSPDESSSTRLIVYKWDKIKQEVCEFFKSETYFSFPENVYGIGMQPLKVSANGVIVTYYETDESSISKRYLLKWDGSRIVMVDN